MNKSFYMKKAIFLDAVKVMNFEIEKDPGYSLQCNQNPSKCPISFLLPKCAILHPLPLWSLLPLSAVAALRAISSDAPSITEPMQSVIQHKSILQMLGLCSMPTVSPAGYLCLPQLCKRNTLVTTSSFPRGRPMAFLLTFREKPFPESVVIQVPSKLFNTFQL